MRAVNSSMLDAYCNIEKYGDEPFINILECKPFVGNVHTERGIRIEDELEKGVHPLSYLIPQGGLWQEWFRSQKYDILFYGKTDYLLHDHIIDIKSKNKYSDLMTYYDSMQWRLYCEALGYTDFEYFIIVEKAKECDFYRERYCYSGIERDELYNAIECMFDYIERRGLSETYHNFLEKKGFI